MKHPAAGGGRWVEVTPDRLVSWIGTFTRRHGGAGTTSRDRDGAAVTFTAEDKATAECHPPFPPLPPFQDHADPAVAAGLIAAHSVADRTVGVLLVRLGGYAVGVFAGSPPRLVGSKTGSRPVHGRSAAGGRSQHRFARRRENQAATALRAAADTAAEVFGPFGPDGLDAVVLGGDKRSIAGLSGDPRLAPYLDRATDRFLTVPDPRLAVLKDTPRAFLAVRIRLTEPGPPGPEPDGPVRTQPVH
jgi:Actinobacteria/chloroflexi VLRF1 release factor